MNIRDYPWKDCVGVGWHKLCENLVEDSLKLGWDGTIFQVKEKFGGLRWYIGSASDEIHERIHQAELESYKICEDCGEAGKPRSGGWIRTLCDDHAKGRPVINWE